MKKIAILTSGGDSQGMNSAYYAVVHHAIQNGLEVYGIKYGYKGLIEGQIKRVYMHSVENVLHRGGTALFTSRCPEMRTTAGKQKAVENLKAHGIEGIVVIGGDGSFMGARALSVEYGINAIGIPGTIDNDLAYTDFTLGFDTAVENAVNNIKVLRDTVYCNDRSMVVEVMGRNCGDIALYAGIESGAEVIVVPEVPYDINKVVERIQSNQAHGKMSNIVIVAEGAGTAEGVCKDITDRMPNLNIRSVNLGHLLRGGHASSQDRLLGIRMGVHAVDCLVAGKTSRVIGVHNNEIFDEDMVEALAKKRVFNKALYDLAWHLGEVK